MLKTNIKKILAAAFFCIGIAFIIWFAAFNQHKSAYALTNTDEKKYIAIIIDDFGNNGAGTEEMLNMDVQLTAAIMPGMISSERDAEVFFKAGKGVILHMPMEPKGGKLSWLGPLAITSNLSSDEIKSNINKGLINIKYAQGINNHMGSKITENPEIIDIIINIAMEKNIVIVDSKTSPKSVIETEAAKIGAKVLTRDIFLDGTQDVKKIENQLLKTKEIADKNGYAIAIGHVGVEGGMATVKAMKNICPKLKEEGYEFVTVSELYEILYE